MKKYENMLHMQRPESRRPRMRRQERAKLFAPFAALSGHDGAIHERARVLVPKLEKAAYGEEILDDALRTIEKGDMVSVTWFCPVERRGEDTVGIYQTITAPVEKLDLHTRVMHLGGRKIDFEALEKLRKIEER